MSSDNRFSSIVALHREKYPEMESPDYIKLCYQNAFGPSHLLSYPDRAYTALKAELTSISATAGENVPIGNSLSRFALSPDADADLIMQLLQLTVSHQIEDTARFKANLRVLEELNINYSKTEVEAHFENGNYQPFLHSAAFVKEYNPHYRIMREEYALFYPLFTAIKSCLERKGSVRVEIDGECGSGKSKLASLIEEIFDARIFHIDDYYLPVAEREKDWNKRWGGNIDFPRFSSEVIDHLDEDVTQRAYSCQKKCYLPPKTVKKRRVTVVEGSYSGFSQYASAYDLRVFLSCSKEVKETRLKEREGSYYDMFLSTWIPLEESYLMLDEPEKRASLKFDTSSL